MSIDKIEQTQLDFHAEAVTIIGPGNSPDPVTKRGAPAYDYIIGKYTVTIFEYVKFLNAICRSNPNGLFKNEMSEMPGGIIRTGNNGSYKYTFDVLFQNFPIVNVNWFDCARFCNWMSNNMPNGDQNSSTTENGAYNMNVPIWEDNVVLILNSINPNTREPPLFRMPFEDEWYKAAYYSPNKGGEGVGGYWTYATQNDRQPGTKIGPDPNQANWNMGIGRIIKVGSFTGSPSFYGTFDQTGNIEEWTYGAASYTDDGNNFFDLYPIVRNVDGYASKLNEASKNFRYQDSPKCYSKIRGFRLASTKTRTSALEQYLRRPFPSDSKIINLRPSGWTKDGNSYIINCSSDIPVSRLSAYIAKVSDGTIVSGYGDQNRPIEDPTDRGSMNYYINNPEVPIDCLTTQIGVYRIFDLPKDIQNDLTVIVTKEYNGHNFRSALVIPASALLPKPPLPELGPIVPIGYDNVQIQITNYDSKYKWSIVPRDSNDLKNIDAGINSNGVITISRISKDPKWIESPQMVWILSVSYISGENQIITSVILNSKEYSPKPFPVLDATMAPTIDGIATQVINYQNINAVAKDLGYFTNWTVEATASDYGRKLFATISKDGQINVSGAGQDPTEVNLKIGLIFVGKETVDKTINFIFYTMGKAKIPELSDYSPKDFGFTVTIKNYDPSWTWSGLCVTKDGDIVGKVTIEPSSNTEAIATVSNLRIPFDCESDMSGYLTIEAAKKNHPVGKTQIVGKRNPLPKLPPLFRDREPKINKQRGLLSARPISYTIAGDGNLSSLVNMSIFSKPDVSMEMVEVGDEGNFSDGISIGFVGYKYTIGKYCVTGSQYTTFLNAVGSTDTYLLYNENMGTDTKVAQISRSGTSGSYTYAVLNDTGQRPITYVSWFDCARFCNWMSNGQPSGAQNSTTTENGAYNVNGKTTGIAMSANNINPNTNLAPTFRMPTENEWVKAAYYSITYKVRTAYSWLDGYYNYPTQSDTIPDDATVANYNGVVGHATDVGSYPYPSFYGTYDQTSNVSEWNDLDGTPNNNRGQLGSSWERWISTVYWKEAMESPRNSKSASDTIFTWLAELAGRSRGFRVAGLSKQQIDLVGSGSVGSQILSQVLKIPYEKLTFPSTQTVINRLGTYEALISHIVDSDISTKITISAIDITNNSSPVEDIEIKVIQGKTESIADIYTTGSYFIGKKSSAITGLKQERTYRVIFYFEYTDLRRNIIYQASKIEKKISVPKDLHIETDMDSSSSLIKYKVHYEGQGKSRLHTIRPVPLEIIRNEWYYPQPPDDNWSYSTDIIIPNHKGLDISFTERQPGEINRCLFHNVITFDDGFPPEDFKTELNTLIHKDGLSHIHSQIVKSKEYIIGLSPPIFKVVTPNDIGKRDYKKLVEIIEKYQGVFWRNLYRLFYIDVLYPPYIPTFNWKAIPTEQIVATLKDKRYYNESYIATGMNDNSTHFFSQQGREGIPPEIKYSVALGVVKTPMNRWDLHQPNAQKFIILSDDLKKRDVQTTSSITIDPPRVTDEESRLFYGDPSRR